MPGATLGAVKAVAGAPNEVEVLVPYGGPYGGADSDGDWFDEGTDFSIPGLPDLPRPVVEYHAEKDAVDEPVGHAVDYRDEPGVGRWYRVVMDTTKRAASRLLDALREGALRASSQAVMSFVPPSSSSGGWELPVGAVP